MAAMVLLVKACGLQRVFDVRPDIMLHTFRPGNFIGSEAVEQFVLLSQSETVRVDPGTVNTSESLVQILLAVLGALDQGHLLERSELLSPGGLNIAGQDSDTVSSTLRQG